MPVAIGFASDLELDGHFTKHKAEFGVVTKADYLAKALAFLNADRSKDTALYECVRRNGYILRLHIGTNEFAIMTPAGIILTYYKPVPRHEASLGTPLGRMHRFRNNLAYFKDCCNE